MERQKRTTWQEFLRAHSEVLAAADFFTVEVWTGAGLTPYAVFFVIDLATRRVEIADMVSEPDSARSRFNAIPLEDVSDRAAGDAVADWRAR